MTDKIRKTASHKERAITLAAMVQVSQRYGLTIGQEPSQDYLVALNEERNSLVFKIINEPELHIKIMEDYARHLKKSVQNTMQEITPHDLDNVLASKSLSKLQFEPAASLTEDIHVEPLVGATGKSVT